MNGVHVNLVDIGTFLTIDLYAHKMPVHYFGYFVVFETFAFHYMAPMAGRITYTD
ncbi:hypothetical protein D3C73_1480290 [compost metagenome]